MRGKIEGSVQFIDAFGEEFSVPYFLLESIARLDCLEAVHPTIAEISIPQTKVHGPAIITIDEQ